MPLRIAQLPAVALLALAAPLAGAPPAAPAPLPPAPLPAAPLASVTAVPRAGGWQWPLAGEPVVLRAFEAPAQRWAPGHRGVDLAAGAGAAVLAPTDAVVVFAGWVVDRPVLSLATAGGLRVTLEPVTASAAVGTRVRRGQVVGTTAPSGGHCAGCLHWGVRSGRDRYLDPLAVLAGAVAPPPVLLPL